MSLSDLTVLRELAELRHELKHDIMQKVTQKISELENLIQRNPHLARLVLRVQRGPVVEFLKKLENIGHTELGRMLKKLSVYEKLKKIIRFMKKEGIITEEQAKKFERIIERLSHRVYAS